MNLSADVRSQLMSLAGITDPAEFDQMVSRLLPQAAEVAAAQAAKDKSKSATGERVGLGAPEAANMVGPIDQSAKFLKMGFSLQFRFLKNIAL